MKERETRTPRQEADMQRFDEQPEPVEEFLARYLGAIQNGAEPPSLDSLPEGVRAEVEELLDVLGPSDDPDAADLDQEGDDGVGLRPLAESVFAVERGFIRSAPDVVIVGAVVHRARVAARLAPSDMARELTRRGYTTDAATVAELEGSSAYRMPPGQARLLAALLELPLAAIEAKAEPWSPERASLSTLEEAGIDAVVLGDDVVVRTAAGSHLGLICCEGDAAVLDSRTYRSVAATLLNGPWSHLAGALLVTEAPPHLALPVDALDCVTRSHAPTGVAGFSRLGAPAPLAEALAAYDRAFSVSWADPALLDDASARPVGAEALADRLVDLAQQVRKEARRARQPGKRPGYEVAARWLHDSDPHDVAALLDELAGTSLERARERLGEVLSP